MEDLGLEDVKAEGSGAADDRWIPEDHVPNVGPTAVQAALEQQAHLAEVGVISH